MTPENWIWIFVLPLAAGPFVGLFGRLSYRAGLTKGRNNIAQVACLLVLLATWMPFVAAYNAFKAQGPLSFQLGSIFMRFDGVSLLMSAVVLGLTTLVAFYSGAYLTGDDEQEKYYALLPIMAGAMIGLSCAADLFNLWVWFEAMALSSFLLVAFYRNNGSALEAGMKYLVQSAAGSMMVVFGIAIVFAQTGVLGLQDIHQKLAAGGLPTLPLLAAGALFVIGFGVKTALVPMHTWLPDAHSQAPSGISAMLSGVVIEAGLVALLRSLTVLSPLSTSWGAILLGFGAINMLLGNLMALRQTQVKRLLAFSSLAHVGYMLVGIGAAMTFNQVDGAQGGMFHLLNHASMKGLAFLAAGTLLYALHVARGDHHPLTVGDLAGASRRYPVTAFALSVALLALGGLPPFSGFMSKWQIFVAGFETHNALMIGLVIFAAMNSVLSLGYYAPLVNAMYRRKPSATVEAGAAIPVSMVLPLVVLVAVVVVLGFWPTLVSGLTLPAGQDFLAAFGG